MFENLRITGGVIQTILTNQNAEFVSLQCPLHGVCIDEGSVVTGIMCLSHVLFMS